MKTCLIVDDSQPLRSIAAKIIAALGFAVSEAGDGAEALAICRDRMPDAILLDWNMPVMSGIEFLRALAREASRLPPVIFCSGESSVGHIREAIAAGAADYVMKPFDRDILALKLREAGLIG